MIRFIKRDAFSGKLSALYTAEEAVAAQVDEEARSDGAALLRALVNDDRS